jgi:RimJ/RimL family protein N-acetyltransferase
LLDKSIPYHTVLMKRPREAPFAESKLPDGFFFTKYEPGDDVHWAEIEASVLEFANAAESLQYFREKYLPEVEDISKRTIFINTSDHEKVGTLTSWCNYAGDIRQSSLHWVGIKPEFQGRGLGRPLVNFGIKTIFELDGIQDIYIYTQTWSHKAVAVYLKEGFQFLKGESFGGFKDDFDAALPWLRQKIAGLPD